MLWIFLFISWLIFNGRVTIELLIFGAGLATVINIFCCKVLGYSGRLDKIIFKNFGRIVKYMFILVWEIIKANIGVMKFVDDGEVDDKIVAVPADDRNNGNSINSLEDVPNQLIKQIEFHFNHYKDMKKPGTTKVESWGDIDEAKSVVKDAISRWNNR